MSDSIASLGIRIDSSQAATAAANLNQLGAAAKTAAGASDNLTASTHDTAAAHGGMSTQAMAAQHSIRSMIEGMAQGIPVTQMLGMQMNHLSYAATGPGGITGAFKQAGGALLGLLSPATLVIGGVAAIAAGTAIAIHSIAAMGKAFDDTARSAGTTNDSLHALASAASFKGIDNADFLKAMDRFGASVYDAQHNMGGLAELMRANGQSASDFAGYMAKTADMIKNAASDQARLQILQQAGLPATMDWVRFLSQGADGIKRATDAAAQFNASAEGQLIAKAREFDEKWNTSWTNWTNRAKNATLTVAGWLDAAIDKMQRLSNDTYNGGARNQSPGQSLIPGAQGFKGNTGYTPDPYGTKATVDPNVLKQQISLEQQHIGLLGQMATASDAVRQVELTVQSARLNGVSITNSQVEALKRLAQEQTLGITAIKANTDSLNVEAATVGMSAGQAAQYAAAQNAINDARRAGRTLTPENVQAIRDEAAALGAAAQNADNMKSAYTGLVQGPMQAFTSAISQGSTAMEALKKAGISALNALATKLTDIAAQNLWGAAFGGSAGGGGGIMSLLGLGGATGGVNADGTIAGAIGQTSVGGVALHHSGYGPGDTGGASRVVDMSMFARAPRFHTGIGPGETPAIIRKDESVLTPGQMKALGNMGGGNTHVSVGVSVDNNGNLQAYVKNVSQQSAVDGVNAFAKSPAFVDHVSAAAVKGRSRRLVNA